MEKQQKLDAPAPNSCIYNARVHIGKLKWGKMNFLDHGKIAKLLLHGGISAVHVTIPRNAHTL